MYCRRCGRSTRKIEMENGSKYECTSCSYAWVERKDNIRKRIVNDDDRGGICGNIIGLSNDTRYKYDESRYCEKCMRKRRVLMYVESYKKTYVEYCKCKTCGEMWSEEKLYSTWDYFVGTLTSWPM
jgi:hypothetical protein